ncbi:hypothetical protein [Gracilimonas mengyeensis]|uniref:Uncharacterized protein n=1 Tax=Gracilimonas mengyeensis TaxID=1302730 RepID=A0A521D5G9_9BACT|nr:hypothetical protein [Gracilimonas mengyeensis]SMO66905.1 hypothetical protein SAMN06265219_107138 [Gracilimonas mengyeensis]
MRERSPINIIFFSFFIILLASVILFTNHASVKWLAYGGIIVGQGALVFNELQEHKKYFGDKERG